MHPSDQLFLFWTKWKSLTIVEGQEIRRENWELLSVVQQRKAELQERAHDLGILSIPEPQKSNNALRRLVDEIMELEQNNARELTLRLQNTQLQLAEMERGRSVLGKVKNSYGRKPVGVWSSYS